ncbi:Cell wall / vacuolar inhibitor of fructosidase 1 [Linum grandiflorum]
MATLTTKLASLTSIFLVVIFLSHNISLTAADKDFIVGTCKNTPFFKVCVSALLADPRGLKANDVTSLALVLIDSVQAKGLVIYNEIKKLQATNPELKKLLKQCADDYDVVVHEDHDEAVEAVSDGDPKFGEDAISNVQGHSETCEDSLKNYSKKSPLIQLNSAVYEIAGVTRAVIRMLE